MNDFFIRVEELLKEQGKTQKEFSEAVGLAAPQSYITQRNRGTYPKADMAVKMADYLGVSVEYLVNGVEKDSYKSRYESLKTAVQDAIDKN